MCVAPAAYCRDALPEADGGAIIQPGGSGRLWRWLCAGLAVVVRVCEFGLMSVLKDIRLLKRRAVGIGLPRPDGHFFGNTEIKCRAMARRERELERSE